MPTTGDRPSSTARAAGNKAAGWSAATPAARPPGRRCSICDASRTIPNDSVWTSNVIIISQSFVPRYRQLGVRTRSGHALPALPPTNAAASVGSPRIVAQPATLPR